MRCVALPRAARLDYIEEQHRPGSICIWMRHFRNWVACHLCRSGPPPVGHDIDGRGLNIPCSRYGRIMCVVPDQDYNMAVRVLPPILPCDTLIGDILNCVEHCAKVMGGRQVGHDQYDSYRRCKKARWRQKPKCQRNRPPTGSFQHLQTNL